MLCSLTHHGRRRGIAGLVQTLLRDTVPVRRAQLAHQVAHALKVQSRLAAPGHPAAMTFELSDFIFKSAERAQLVHRRVTRALEVPPSLAACSRPAAQRSSSHTACWSAYACKIERLTMCLL